MAASSRELIENLQKFIDAMPFARPMGIQVAEARRGFVSLRMNPTQALFNQMNTYQAGALFTLAEITGGTFCGTFLDLSKNFLITKKSHVEFLRATGEELIGESQLSENDIEKALAELDQRRKLDFPVDVRVQTPAGEPVLNGQFIYYLRMGVPHSFQRS